MIIDLTQTFSASMPVFPGDPETELVPLADIKSFGYADYQIKTGMHVGTHVEGPMHMIAGGAYLSEIDAQRFVGRGVLVDAREHSLIDTNLLGDISLRRGDIVLVLTGYSKYFRDAEYFLSYPEMTTEFAQALVAAKIHAVGMDTPSPDRLPCEVHHLLLGSGVLIIENLTNLDALLGVSDFEVFALPAKFQTDAAPARVIARTRQ